SHYHNTKRLENLVVDKIRERILTPENLTELAEEVSKEMNTRSKIYETELNSIEGEIVDVVRRLERLYEVIETGKVVPDDVGPRIHDLKERREKLQGRKEDLQLIVAGQSAEAPSREEVTACAEDLRNILGRGSLAEKKAFIRSFVKEVKITGDEANLTYILPSRQGGLTEETESVLGIGRYGGQ
ncbi:MAG: recombinase family protein, partial [Dehalococcoidia bacterium]|nr:recombinase family protein [Dehalococcoidia bacterium]